MRLLALLLPLLLLGCEEPIPEPVPPPPAPTEPPSESELLAARPYNLTVPSTYAETAEWPLLVVLHGYGGSATDVSTYFNLDVLPEREGVLLVLPDGLQDRLGNRAWHPNRSRYPDWDRSWLTAVIHDVKAKYRIDPRRVFVFGFSQGAHMAHRMACDDSEDVAAIVSVAGQVTKSAEFCAPPTPVSVLQIHGTDDEAIGYDGDLSNPPSAAVPSAHETVAVWARNDVCTGALTRASARLDLSKQVSGFETDIDAYEGCPAGIDVQLWTMQGVTHRCEPTPGFVNRVWLFLSSHPKP